MITISFKNGLCTHFTVAVAIPIHPIERNRNRNVIHNRNRVINCRCEWTITRVGLTLRNHTDTGMKLINMYVHAYHIWLKLEETYTYMYIPSQVVELKVWWFFGGSIFHKTFWRLKAFLSRTPHCSQRDQRNKSIDSLKFYAFFQWPFFQIESEEHKMHVSQYLYSHWCKTTE